MSMICHHLYEDYSSLFKHKRQSITNEISIICVYIRNTLVKKKFRLVLKI